LSGIELSRCEGRQAISSHVGRTHFVEQLGALDGDEVRFGFGGDCFGEQGFAAAWRAPEEDAGGRGYADFGVAFGVLDWLDDGHLEFVAHAFQGADVAP
jgi:hypothetical protein